MLPAVQPFGAPTLRPRSGPEPGLEIVTHAASDLFYLPAVDLPSDRRLVLELDISSPLDTTLTVLYTTGTQSSYKRENSYSAALTSGRNTVYVHLAAFDIQGRLLVRPGALPGTFVLHRAEIRACARD